MSTINYRLLFLLTLIVFLTAGWRWPFSDKIADEINKHFPVVTLDKIRTDSLSNNLKALNRSDSVDVRFWVNENILNDQLSNNIDLKKQGVENISLGFENQVPAVHINFKRRFELIGGIPISVEGHLDGYLVLARKSHFLKIHYYI